MPFNRENLPAGLVLLADIVARIPERAMDVVERERQLNGLRLLSIHQMQKVYSWNPGRTIWVAVLIGVTVFSALWSTSTVLGMFSSTGQTLTGTMKELNQLGIQLPQNVASPFTSMMGIADAMPAYSGGDMIAYTVGSILLYAIYKFLTVLPNLDRLKLLQEEEKRLEEERRYLDAWMDDLIRARTNG